MSTVTTYTLNVNDISYTESTQTYLASHIYNFPNSEYRIQLDFTTIFNTYTNTIVEVTTFIKSTTSTSSSFKDYYGKCLVCIMGGTSSPGNVGVQSIYETAGVAFSVSGKILTIIFAQLNTQIQYTTNIGCSFNVRIPGGA